MPIAGFEALRWRVQCQPLVGIAQKLGRCRLVIYEELCADPLRQATALFAFLGWEFGRSPRAFLDASVAGPRSARSPRQAFFSVYRDPAESLAKWKTQLTGEQISEIGEVIRDSPLTRLWPDFAHADVR